MLLTNIPLTNAQIFAVIGDSQMDLGTRLQTAGWVVGQIFQILVFSSAALINWKSGNFRDVLHSRYMKWSRNADFLRPATGTHLQRISLLLDQMMNQPLGFTVWSLFLINTSTLITMFSLVFTYFMLVIQFAWQPEAICNCNCTGFI